AGSARLEAHRIRRAGRRGDTHPRRRRVPRPLRLEVPGSGLRAPRFSEEGPEDARPRDIARERALQESPPGGGSKMKTAPTKPNADVFRDLGFPPAEAENLRIRAAMMNALIAEVEKK